MRLHRRAGAATASEGHCRCTSADVSVCALYALRPSDIVFFFRPGKGPLISQESQHAFVVFFTVQHTLNITLSHLILVRVFNLSLSRCMDYVYLLQNNKDGLEQRYRIKSYANGMKCNTLLVS